MYFLLPIHSREALIAFGRKIAEAVEAAPRPDARARLIVAGGDSDAGKSFTALAADYAWNPARYPDGLNKNISADTLLIYDPHLSKMVVFQNMDGRVKATRGAFDAALELFDAGFRPRHGIIYLSNLKRIEGKPFDYESNGLDSRRLDLHLHSRIEPGPFIRTIGVTVEDEKLIAQLNPEMLAARVNGSPRTAQSTGTPPEALHRR